ncbi:CheR family methyltransferase [Pseudomonas subflava]|uniref:CheR family methyltransferase n=1 Tax=Pseudomonas subflava TaxID=2952933 RepID=UPI00207AFB62|nr:CheR family methyltransferase [Pseudomonas subflava]
MRQAEPLCSPRLLELLASKVHRHLGMDFSGARQPELQRRLRLLAEDQTEDTTAWLESLAFAEWDDARIERLIPAFTVGETYFRRDPEALDWLARQHLAPLLQRRRAAGQRHLRVWSAACCTGEEAYSLLFLLDDLLGAERGQWSLEVLASDINAGFLARAEQGRYGQNAFRRNEEAFRQRHFQAEARAWRVRPQWRERIRFQRHNLATGSLPDRRRGLAEVDLILCRNVLMYFSAEHASATLRRLLACLSADGMLVLSAVEAGLATQAGLSGFWAGSNYALAADARQPPSPPAAVLPAVAAQAPRPRREPARHEPPAEPAEPLRERLWQQAQEALQRGDHAQARQALQDYLSQPGLTIVQRYQSCLALARSWAEQQRGDEAREWLQNALEIDPAALPAYWLSALLERQEGDLPAALQALHKLLYLAPECSMGHFQQGLLLRETGKRQAGDRALRTCQRQLLESENDAPLQFAEGLGRVQLLALCEQLLGDRPCPPS